MSSPITDEDYPADPYPGARPPHSFLHELQRGRLLEPAGRSPWSFRVDGVSDLDDVLARRGAPALAARVPILAYGSNACPSKITWLRTELGLAGPVIVLRVRTNGLAAVWSAGLRLRDGQRPATLCAAPGVGETHAVWLADEDQVRVLDACEGRGDRYHLARLRTGEIRTEDGLLLPEVLAYVGANDPRRPLLVREKPVRCAEVPQAQAHALDGSVGTDGLDTEIIDGAPKAENWPDRLFVYGTLQPTGTAWHRARPWCVGEPERATLTGTLYDTGLGWPALRLSGQDEVPGWSLRLRDPAAALAALDDYEGDGYRRVRVVLADGTLVWTYEWTDPVTGMTRLTRGW